MGWHAKDAPFRINARSGEDHYINGDLDPINGDTGVFVLRDFVTTGDAMRIRMPFLPKEEYQQWLWVENHQCFARNGSPTDRYHWEPMSCVESAPAGLYMEMQIDREKRSGSDIYGGNADYLRPVTACGHFDLALTSDTIHDRCPFSGEAIVYERTGANPLSGNSEQELIIYDRNMDRALERGEHFVPNVAQLPQGISNTARFFGRPEHAFTRYGNASVSMGSNPSSANMLSLTCNGKREKNKAALPDNRTVRLNGIRVELLEQRVDGSIVVRVTTNDTRVTNDVRWCADSIVLPPLHGADGRSLTLASGKHMLLDRSRTPTRMTLQEEVHGFRYFAPPTRFTISAGASVKLEAKCELRMENGSVLHLLPGAELALDPSAKLAIDASSRIILHGDAKLSAKARILKKLRRKKRILSVDQ